VHSWSCWQALLRFAGTIRSVLGGAEATVPGSVQLARVAFAGAVVGAAGIATAIVMVGAAASEGADADPVVSRAVTTASAGPYLVAAMGFAAVLGAAGLLTLRSGVLPRWTGHRGTDRRGRLSHHAIDRYRGHRRRQCVRRRFPARGILSLVIWSIAASIASYRALATIGRRRGD
jgi:hypothetical protein